MMSRHPILFSFLIVGSICFFLLFGLVGLAFLASGEGSQMLPTEQIAVVKIEGPIFDATDTLEELQELGENNRIKAIVLRIDSPGGAVAPSQEIFEEVKKLKAHKKIVISMGTLAASGGYYIACAGHKIFASPGSITGSIGVIMEGFNVEGLMEWARVRQDTLKSGKYKDVGSPFRTMSDEEKAYMQSLLDNMYEQFKKAVAEQRGMTPERIEEIAQGRVYTGEQAIGVGLVDTLGNLYDAIEEAKKLAGLPKDAKVSWPREPGSFFERMLNPESKTQMQNILEQIFRTGGAPLGLYLNSSTLMIH